MKNVLFIVYYFPPMGGSGVQRPLKFIKYLREFGWNPIVLCPEPGRYPYFDESLQRELEAISPEVIRIKPKTIFHYGTGSSPRKRVTVSNRIAKAIRRVLRFFMYPDNKRGWIEPAVERGLEVIQRKNIDLIFSTAPPFSNHVAAATISKKSGLPLVLDYRDLWLENHFQDDMFRWQKRKMKKMESVCLEQTAAITALDPSMLESIRSSYPEIQVKNRSYIIPHGFDPEDLDRKNGDSNFRYKEGKFNILYSGLFYEQNQPDIFLHALKKADADGSIDLSDIHLHFQGGLDKRINNLIGELGFRESVTDYGYLTHEVAVSNLKQADLLWMISNFAPNHTQIKSGKLFEYIGTGKPILGLAHDGEEAHLLEQYNAGYFGDLKSEKIIISEIARLYDLWSDGKLPEGDLDFRFQYDRKKITKDLAQIFDKISPH
ncbi:glycosyltransferase [Gracilimonas halophila]|uniref:Glycosyltransferase n=1 Tax=Gracilimonas halophila TaxID=1834464 RepID=A0ABW5JPM5_9BACT